MSSQTSTSAHVKRHDRDETHIDVPEEVFRLEQVLPQQLQALDNPQTDLPRIARDPNLTSLISEAVAKIPTHHRLYLHDARNIGFLKPNSIHLAITSPPYWTLKEYPEVEGQLGRISNYEDFLDSLDDVWQQIYDALVPGGRLIVVVGDVCLSRRKNRGRHTVVPLHASIQERCRRIGFDNLTPIIWHKITKAKYEVENGSTFMGKPYEPNAVIKNDIEFILMERKPGGYRKPTVSARVLSVISAENHRQWFQQIWTGLTGASTKNHPAPFPVELAERLIRMFSFVGDTVLDPFAGTGSTCIAAANCGRNSVGVEIHPGYLDLAEPRIRHETETPFNKARVEVIRSLSEVD